MARIKRSKSFGRMSPEERMEYAISFTADVTFPMTEEDEIRMEKAIVESINKFHPVPVVQTQTQESLVPLESFVF